MDNLLVLLRDHQDTLLKIGIPQSELVYTQNYLVQRVGETTLVLAIRSSTSDHHLIATIQLFETDRLYQSPIGISNPKYYRYFTVNTTETHPEDWLWISQNLASIGALHLV